MNELIKFTSASKKDEASGGLTVKASQFGVATLREGKYVTIGVVVRNGRERTLTGKVVRGGRDIYFSGCRRKLNHCYPSSGLTFPKVGSPRNWRVSFMSFYL